MSIKLRRATKLGNWHKGTITTAAVLEQIPADVIKALPSRLIAQVADAIDKAYHTGKASAGAEMIDSNVVWVNSLNRGIEWTEVNAKYETVSVAEYVDGRKINVTKSVKVEDGEIILRFTDAKNA